MPLSARYKGIIESQGTLSGVVSKSKSPFDVTAAIDIGARKGIRGKSKI